MPTDKQHKIIQIIMFVKKHKDELSGLMRDPGLFFDNERSYVVEGFHFLADFDLSNKKHILSLDTLEDFNVHNGKSPREHYYENTKNIDMNTIFSEFEEWYTSHARHIQDMVKRMKDPAFKKARLEISVPTPIYEPPSLTSSPIYDGQTSIFPFPEPSPIIRGRKSVRHPNPEIDHLECYYNTNPTHTENDTKEPHSENLKSNISETDKLFEMDTKYHEIDNIKYFRNHDNDNGVYEKQSRKVLNYKNDISNRLCENIPRGYANTSFRSANLLLCLVRREKDDNDGSRARILGFATLELEPSGILYIAIICASLEMKGGGSKLMQGIKQIARQIKCKSIHLETVNDKDTIRFYLKESFKFTGLTKKNEKALYCNEENDFEERHVVHDDADIDEVDLDKKTNSPDLCMMKYEFSGGRKKTVKRKKYNNRKSRKIKSKK